MLPRHVGSWGGYGQVPLSGTYRIKSANNTYVQIKGKYYAKPDATLADASEVGVGIGYNTGDGYRVYSLTGTNPTDKSQIEVYKYVDKAYKIVSEFAQNELNKKLDAHKDLLQALLSDPANVEEVKTALDAMADSICGIYTDDYAYMTLVPQAHYGDKWIVRAKATVPAIPYTIQAAGNYVVTGADVRGDGHKATDVWDWAKQHVLKYLDAHQTDERLKQLVEKYLDQVTPGTTYYLSYDKSDNSFGYTTTPTDAGLWTMEAVNTTADKLTPGVVNIKNNSTDHYVSVAGKYDAEPSMTLSDIESSDANKRKAAITLDFGRLNRSDANLYRLTELSNQGQDVVGYLAKGMDKAFNVLDVKLKEKNAYTKLAEFINGMLTNKGINYSITADNVRADVKTAVDLCADHYAYMKLIDNGDGSVKLRVDVPKVPALLDLAVEMYKQQKTKDDWKVSDEEVTTQGAKANSLADGDEELANLLKRAESNGSSAFENFAKEQIDKYFESSETTEALKKLWRQNRDKWHFGHTYYLSAEGTYNTFEFTENGNDAAAQWTLADVDAADSKTNPYRGYFRIKNVGGYNGQQYIDVRGRKTADVTATDADKVTKPGTVLYVNLDTKGTNVSSPYVANTTVKGYELLNLRSQGLDVMNGAEATTAELKNLFSNVTLEGLKGGDLTPAYAGYVGFARYLLAAGAAVADEHIGSYAESYYGAEAKKKFDALMTDFNANYLPNLKFQVYLLPVEGKENTYLVRSQVPSLKPIVDFYKANKADMDAVVVPAVRQFLTDHKNITGLVGFSGEKFSDADDEEINSWYSAHGGEWHMKNCCEKDAQGNLIKDADGNYTLSYSTILGSEQIMFDWLKLQMLKALDKLGVDATLDGYVKMIHYNTPYYLIEGDNHDAQGNRVYTGNAELGFGNDGLKANTATGDSPANDLTQAKEHAYWTLEPVSGDNYFTVKPNPNAAKNGKYYSSTYLDFPFQATGSNVSAVYKVDDKGVQSDTKADGTVYKYVTFEPVTGVVPAGTPVIIEFNTPTVASDLALTPVLSDARTTVSSDALVQGTFLGGKHNVSNSSLTDGTIQQKWGVGTDGKDLYLWGYNTKDTFNPYGFYRYSKSNEDESSKYNLIPANKPFLVMEPNSTAKVYVMFGDGETTSISNLLNTTTTMPANATRYNLAGQRVNSNYKGVVIVNGHKYIQK